MGPGIVAVGVIMIVTGAVATMATSASARRAGLDANDMLAARVVPKWVSLLYLSGFVVTAVGAVAWLAG